MDKFVSMEIFVAVVEAGSLTAAAERFDISSAMVGKHIRSLETQLSTRLLTRTTRRQSLTEIGRQYYEQCRRILADVKAAESLAEAMTSAPGAGDHSLVSPRPRACCMCARCWICTARTT